MKIVKYECDKCHIEIDKKESHIHFDIDNHCVFNLCLKCCEAIQVKLRTTVRLEGSLACLPVHQTNELIAQIMR